MPDEEKDKAGLLAKKLHHFRKVLRRAAKKARTFETAKLVKKCKALRKDGDAGSGSGVKDDVKKQLEVLEKDMKAMKTLFVDDIGDEALSKAIAKSAKLAEYPLISEAVTLEKLDKENRFPGDLEKLCARVRSNGAFAKTVRETIADLEDSAEAIGEGKKKKRKQLPVKVVLAKKKATNGTTAKAGFGSAKKLTAGSDEEDGEGSEDFDRSVANSDDDESGQSGSEAGGSNEDSDAQSDLYSSDYGEGDFGSGSEDDGGYDSDNLRPSAPPRGASKAAARGRGGKKSSRYDDADLDEKPKNRMGQRARRMQWEKQFGQQANHIKRGGGAGRGGSRGGSRGRGRGGSGTGRGGSFDGRGGRGGFSKFSSNDRPRESSDGFASNKRRADQDQGGPPKKFRSDTPKAGSGSGLHASWEAKMRERQKMQELASKPQGKKIVFD